MRSRTACIVALACCLGVPVATYGAVAVERVDDLIKLMTDRWSGQIRAPVDVSKTPVSGSGMPVPLPYPNIRASTRGEMTDVTFGFGVRKAPGTSSAETESITAVFEGASFTTFAFDVVLQGADGSVFVPSAVHVANTTTLVFDVTGTDLDEFELLISATLPDGEGDRGTLFSLGDFELTNMIITSVPEPGVTTLAVVGLGIFGLWLVLERRRAFQHQQGEQPCANSSASQSH